MFILCAYSFYASFSKLHSGHASFEGPPTILGEGPFVGSPRYYVRYGGFGVDSAFLCQSRYLKFARQAIKVVLCLYSHRTGYCIQVRTHRNISSHLRLDSERLLVHYEYYGSEHATPTTIFAHVTMAQHTGGISECSCYKQHLYDSGVPHVAC